MIEDEKRSAATPKISYPVIILQNDSLYLEQIKKQKVQSSVRENEYMENKIRILLVDDRPENLLTLESILAEDHRQFLSATSGAEALLMTELEDFDLILLDYRLDDMNGIDVAKALRLKPKTSHIPILLVTALSKRESPHLEDFEEGTIEIIYKPLDIELTRNKTRYYEEKTLSRRKEMLVKNQIK